MTDLLRWGIPNRRGRALYEAHRFLVIHEGGSLSRPRSPKATLQSRNPRKKAERCYTRFRNPKASRNQLGYICLVDIYNPILVFIFLDRGLDVIPEEIGQILSFEVKDVFHLLLLTLRNIEINRIPVFLAFYHSDLEVLNIMWICAEKSVIHMPYPKRVPV